MATALQKTGTDLKGYLRDERVQHALLQAAPAHLRTQAGIAKLTSAALTAAQLNPSLMKCDRSSFLKAMIVATQLGLEIGGPLAEAHAIPFKDQVNLIVGYQGLMRLARQSGEIASIESRVVYEGDQFEIRLGSESAVEHVPAAPRLRDARVIGAYAVIHLKDEGARPLIEWMEKADLDAIKERSRASRSGPWQTDTAEMYRKTVLRRALKYAPRSTELGAALLADASSDSGEDTISTMTTLDLSPVEEQDETKALEAELTGGEQQEMES